MNCNAHCASCGRHFSSTSAFDRHRVGPWSDRRCADPDEVDRLYGYEGSCEVCAEPQEGVSVWSTKRSE